jgi:hypothetical protein
LNLKLRVMKNLKTKRFAITALAIGFFAGTAFGQVPQTQQQEQDQSQDQQQQISTQDQNQRASHPDKGVNYSDQVQESELPQAVTSSLDELYPVHEISEVHRGDDDSYRVKVENKNDKAYVYYNSDGNFLRARNEKDIPEGTFSQSQSDMNTQGTATPQEQSQRTREQGTSGQMQSDMEHDEQGTMGTSNDQRTGTMGTGTQDRTGTSTQDWDSQTPDTTRWDNDSDRGTGTMGTGTQDRTGTGTWGTDDADRGTETGTQGTMGTGTQDRTGTGTWGTDDADRGTETGTQGTMGTGTQDRTGTGTWGTDTDRGTETGTQGTMGTGTQDTTRWGTDDDDRGTGTQGTMGTGTQDRTGTGTSTQDTATWSKDYDDSSTGTHYDRGSDQGTTGTFDEESTDNQEQTGTYPQEQSQRSSLDDVEYDDEIEENELPESVTTSLKELYPAHEIEKAFRGDDNSYKVEVKNDNDKASVFFNSDGEFVKAESEENGGLFNRDKKDSDKEGGLFNRNKDKDDNK